MAAYVAGNGNGRRRVCLKQVKAKGKLYGCNAIHKDIIPDVLVAVDEDQAHAIQNAGYAHDHEFYTRKPYADKGGKKLKDKYAKWSSGANALALAVEDGHTEIFVFGMDFGSIGEKVNNIYAGEEFYKDFGDSAVCGRNWAAQVDTIIKHNPQVQFNLVTSGQMVTKYAERLAERENVKIVPLSEFLIHINNV